MRAAAILAFVAAVPLAASPTIAAKPRSGGQAIWRLVITDADRGRLRNWRDAWVLGLAQARAAGEGAEIAREGPLLDPDAGQENPSMPDGDYVCRTIKLGHKTADGLAYVALSPASCRIADGRFTKLDGPQRPNGHLWAFDPTRLIFLGTMALSDEPRALDYGRDGDRDMVGLIERIGAQRWRLVLPQPVWESQIDVIELVPKQPGGISPQSAGE